MWRSWTQDYQELWRKNDEIESMHQWLNFRHFPSRDQIARLNQLVQQSVLQDATYNLELFFALAPSVLDFVAALTAAARPMYRLTFFLQVDREAPFEIENPSTDPRMARITTIAMRRGHFMTAIVPDEIQVTLRKFRDNFVATHCPAYCLEEVSSTTFWDPAFARSNRTTGQRRENKLLTASKLYAAHRAQGVYSPKGKINLKRNPVKIFSGLFFLWQRLSRLWNISSQRYHINLCWVLCH